MENRTRERINMKELNDKETGVLLALGSMGAGVDSYILKDVERIESLTGYSRGVVYAVIQRLMKAKLVRQNNIKNEDIRREIALTERGYDSIKLHYVYVLQALRNSKISTKLN